MSDPFLSGKRVLVTGSIQGIGLAIATTLAGAGMRIALHGIGEADQIDAAMATVLDHGAQEARFFLGDLNDPAAIARMMDAIAAWGGVDILVNNAGIQQTAPIEAVSRDLWDRIMAVNLSAAFHTMQSALPAMAEREYGRVINIASVHGLIGSIEKAPYVASKHGLVGLSKVAALEYAGVGSAKTGGVTVNCICPGWTRTSIILPQVEARAKMLSCDDDMAIADLMREKQPSRRLSDPSEIGALVLWLCGVSAHNLTGAAIPIDGAWTTH